MRTRLETVGLRVFVPVRISYGPIGNRLYCVVFVRRHDVFRIISLRKANRREVQAYEAIQLIKPTVREDRAINAGIKRDPETRDLSRKEFDELRPARRGRLASAAPKVPVTVRLDPNVVQFFRESGPGWQTRMNAALTAYVSRQRRA